MRVPDSATPLSPRENDLRKKWDNVAGHVPVDASQYNYDTTERQQAFIKAQFPTEEEQAHYREYREEWWRRAKEMDPGPMPLAVCIELVSTCNLGCSMCYTITEEYQNSVIGAQRMLPWHIVTAVIDECAAIGVASILFSWRGESSLYRAVSDGHTYRFTDALAYARERGILEITSLTHGQTIDQEMADAIVDAEPSWISFSIDGVADAYNKIRTPPSKEGTGYNAFEVVADSIRMLVKARDSKGLTRPQIRTNTIYPAIAKNPQAYHDFMERIGVGWVTVNELLDFRADDLPDDAIIDNWACQYPFQRLTVSANGVLLPCTGAHNEESGLVLGRYRGSAPKVVRRTDGSVATVRVPEITLAEAWTSPKIEQVRKLHRDNQRTLIDPGCRNCRHGAVKHGAKWIPDDWNMETMEWEGGVWRE